MKTKPVSHKSENTFRFQTFSERIAAVNIDVIHRIGQSSQVPEERETFLLEAVEKWSDLNCTEEFDKLSKKIGRDIQLLPQVLHRKDELVEILQESLQKVDNLALDATLEFVVALARDIQKDFYPYFPKIFTSVCSHLETKDTDMLERLFSCLAYLFKFLWRYMVKDIENVYSLYVPLLGAEHKEHVRNFGAESFAFLLRKVPDKEELLKFIFQKLEDNPTQAQGVGQLLFEMIKGVKKQFHSCTAKVFPLFLKCLGQELSEQFRSLKLPWEHVETALTQTVISMAKHATREFSNIIWIVFCDTLNHLEAKLNILNEQTDRQHVADHLERVLRLLMIWIKHKDGQLVSCLEQLVQTMVGLTECEKLPSGSQKLICHVVSNLLLSDQVDLSVYQTKCLVSAIYKSKFERSVLLDCTRTLFDYKMFEKDILPNCILFCQHAIEENSEEVLAVLTELVLHKRPLFITAEDFSKWSKFSLDFQKSSVNEDRTAGPELPNVPDAILNAIKVDEEGLDKNLQVLWSALVCLPHLRFLDTEAPQHVRAVLLHLFHMLVEPKSQGITVLEKIMFVFSQAICTYSLLQSDETLHGFLSVENMTKLIRLYPTSVIILQAFDFYLTHPFQKVKDIDISILENIFPLMQQNLLSPFHLVRLLTLRILSSFNLPLPSLEDKNLKQTSVFRICLEVEKVPLTVQDYREKLKHLQKLEYRLIQKNLPIGPFERVPVYFLLGSLYNNFKLLWQPIQKLLESHAYGLGKSFWDVYSAQLQKAIDDQGTSSAIQNSFQLNEAWKSGGDSSHSMGKLFLENLCILCLPQERPDFSNYRLLLWQAIRMFPDSAEPRNKELVSLFLYFIREEFSNYDTTLVKTQDISQKEIKNSISCFKQQRKKQKKRVHNKKTCGKRARSVERKKMVKKKVRITEVDDESGVEMDTEPPLSLEGEECVTEYEKAQKEMGNDSDEEIANDMLTPTSKMANSLPDVKEFYDTNNEEESGNNDYNIIEEAKKGKSIIKLLRAHLGVFAKFQNPRAISRSEELHQLYLELLCYRDAEVQKLAFDCVMTYNHKYLTPYKENFYSLLDEKTFKTEATLFSIDSEHGSVQAEHREELLPVLMRILYGKMLYKTGGNTGGKSNAHIRRGIVLRFLAGCNESELKMFLMLAFSPFKHVFDKNPLEIVKNMKRELDLSAVVPVRRQLSIMNTLGTMLKHFGCLAANLLPQLFRVLLSVATQAVTLLERREEICPRFINMLKNLRTMAFIKIIQFFTVYDTYPFSCEEIDAVFESVVWPVLPRLKYEGLNYPPPILRLFSAWSEDPRYFALFSKHHPENKDLTPLSHVMSLYIANKAQPVVVGLITKMLSNLLTLVEDAAESEHRLTTLVVNNLLPISETLEQHSPENEPLNYGTILLLPYVPLILQRLRLIVTRTVKNSKRFIRPEELTILSRISEHVRENKQSEELVDLLIPFVTKSSLRKQDAAEVGVLTTLKNLVFNVDSPSRFIRPMASLFSTLSLRLSRITLCSVFGTIAEKENKLFVLAEVVSKLNSWNPKYAEEPDYNTRLDGYKLAQDVLEKMDSIDIDFVLVVIYNCAYFIRNSDDLSIRDSASYTLQRMAPKFALRMEIDKVAFRVCIAEALLGEVKKGLKAKSEVVRHEYFQVLAALLRHCNNHQRLKDLSLLCDSDIDIDFWENIRHIQLHRRSRALTRFARNLTSGILTMNSLTLMSFMMPIATSFLFDASYSKHSHIVDAAVEAIGSICLFLPWHRYENVLRYYLGLLPKNLEYHKVVVKVIVAILNAFHFDLSHSRGLDAELKIEIKEDKNQNAETADDDSHTAIPPTQETDSGNKESNQVTEFQKELMDEEMATKIHHSIARSLLPQLHRCLTQKTRSDEEHKLAGRSYPEDEEILRVPIAIAMVKLLQALPHGMLEQNLPGLFLKTCNLLKSRSESIRETTRETLIKIMQSLGPHYFWFLLREMRGVMKKGYQIHVLTYTVNAVLTNLIPHLKTGNLDSCLSTLTGICNGELFGDVAEEKEVAKITGKLKEARSSKTYNMYQIMGQFVSEKFIPNLVLPLKEMLDTTNSHKIIRKCQECLRHIVLGLADNKDVSVRALLIYSHGLTQVVFTNVENSSRAPHHSTEPKTQRPDIYSIPAEPPRGGLPVKLSKKTNAHVLVEFGLQLLHVCLKRDKVLPSVQEHMEMLDPFVTVLVECLGSQFVKLISTTLRCLTWILKYPLPSLNTHVPKICKLGFVLLNKYAGPGMGQGENFEMVVTCFKMLTVLVRDVEYYVIEEQQLKVLLSYIEQDIHDHTRQATAFTLLKAILYRQLKTPELEDIMKKVSEMAVISEREHIRAQSRQAFLQYLLDYPLGKKLERHLANCIAQLDYGQESGRTSALEMLNLICNSFPVGVLKSHAGLFFIPLAARLVNDSSSKCRQMAAMIIRNMLTKIDDNEKKNLFSIVIAWIKNRKMAHRRLAAQLCGIFAEVEGQNFKHYLKDILPIIQLQLDPGRYQNITSEEKERGADHLLYHLMIGLSKVLTTCKVVREEVYREDFNLIWEHLQQHILHPHSWVRLGAAQLFGHLFAAYPVEEVVKSASTPDPKANEFLLQDTRQKIRDLAADFCSQFQSIHLTETLAEQVVRNLVYLAKVLRHLSHDSIQNGHHSSIKQKDDEEQDEDSIENEKVVHKSVIVSLRWLIRRVTREAKMEVANNPTITLKRSCVFKWLAAISVDMTQEELTRWLPLMLPSLCRELSDNSLQTVPELKTLAQEVVELMRGVVGVEIFTREYAQVQSFIVQKRTKRKREKTLEAVVNPERSARKKMKKQVKKKDAKKLKMAKQKGKKIKKAKLSEMAMIS
ncbi:small subunit processome component 20 homolog [Limulus polyphemus]|uniref:Small subunit processome component 20 homolog n=1 Tax=Limulus polyphemus TaxID=6850 RepID=A0ABM1S4J5_LIMPO|nr:small subunit processome component 20 homolog [Limulus polyphemus]